MSVAERIEWFLYCALASLYQYLRLQVLSIACTGARVVISHPQGREVLKQQQQHYPDVINSDLPEKTTLQKVAADHSFDMVEFVDEPSFYLAVLKLS